MLKKNSFFSLKDRAFAKNYPQQVDKDQLDF